MSMGGVTGFRVGAVLGRSIWVLRRNFAVFGTLAVLFIWPSLFLSGDPDVSGGSNTPAVDDAIAGIGELGLGSAAVVVVVLIVLALYMLASCTMVYGTFQVLRERRVGVGECIRQGLPAVPRVIGIAILSTLAILLIGGLLSVPGFLIATSGGSLFGMVWIFAAFTIPGLMLYSALWVAVPVAVVERTGVVAGMNRSAKLTRGYRWRVFGILLVLGLLNGAAEWIATLPFDLGGTAHSVAEFAVAVVFTAWSAVAAAVAYHDLRLEKEGIGVNEIAAVFD